MDSTYLQILKLKPKSDTNNDEKNPDHHHYLTKLEYIGAHLDARRIEFITTAVICVIFAISFAR